MGDSPKPLEGKVALVTGASRGIGRAAAGADVAVNYKMHEPGAVAACERIGELGRRGIVIGADVSSAADVAGLIGRVRRELGPVDVLVNNAGITRPEPIDEITEQSWDDVVVLLATNGYITGQTINVNGGWYMS